MLEGKKVNLRVTEKEDLPLLTEWWNDPKFTGEYLPFPTQDSRTDMEKMFEKNRSAPDGLRGFIIEKKDRTRIGNVTFYNSYIGGAKLLEIG